MQQAIEAFHRHRSQAGRATGTRQLYTRQLDLFRAWMESHQVTTLAAITIDHLRDFFHFLQTEYRPNSSPTSRRPPGPPGSLSQHALASHRRTLRAFWRYCELEGWLTTEQATFFSRLPSITPDDAPRPAADPALLRALVAACGDGADEVSARDIAMLRLLAESGMRVSDLCALTDDGVDLAKRRARVQGKGRKWRWVYWRPTGAAALGRYLLLRSGKKGGPLFRGASVKNPGGAATPDLVRSRLKRIAEGAGIPLPKGAPLHSFRHAFARDAIARGADISEVSQFLGHANVQTTMTYLRHDPEKLQEAYNRVYGLTPPAEPRRRQRDAE